MSVIHGQQHPTPPTSLPLPGQPIWQLTSARPSHAAAEEPWRSTWSLKYWKLGGCYGLFTYTLRQNEGTRIEYEIGQDITTRGNKLSTGCVGSSSLGKEEFQARGPLLCGSVEPAFPNNNHNHWKLWFARYREPNSMEWAHIIGKVISKDPSLHLFVILSVAFLCNTARHKNCHSLCKQNGHRFVSPDIRLFSNCTKLAFLKQTGND